MSKVYTNVERAVLQFVMASGPVKQEHLATVHQKMREEVETDELFPEQVTLVKERDLDNCVDVINGRLHDLGFEIIRAKTQDTQELLYIYVNRVNDTASQAFTRHSKPEIEAIKKIIDSIFTNNEDEEQFIITSTMAMKICQSEANKTATQAEVFLKELVNEGWFDYSSSGTYYLSTKSLTELRRVLLDKYGAKTLDPNSDGLVNICQGCRGIVTRGVRCSNRQCNVRFHSNCQANYVRARGSACPNEECTADWSQQELLHYVGEKAMAKKRQYVEIDD